MRPRRTFRVRASLRRLREVLFTLALFHALAARPIAQADSDTRTNLTPTGDVLYTQTGGIEGAGYTSVIRLHHAGADSGRLLATFEDASTQVLAIFQSDDDGVHWTGPIASVRESIEGATPFFGLRTPRLYELPTPQGDLAEGTIVLATSAFFDRYQVNEFYVSSDQGRTWSARGTLPIERNGFAGEPHLETASDGSLVCYYSDETHRTGSGLNQAIVHRVSRDGGKSWGAESFDVAFPNDPDARPGMPVVLRMPNGQYVMSLEAVGYGRERSPVFIKFSSDGLHWGPADSWGTRVRSASGAFPGATPYLAWLPAPAGGPEGGLVISSQFLLGTSSNARELFVNGSFGQGDWYTVRAPVQWNGGGNAHSGWTQALLPTRNNQGVIQLAGSDVGGNDTQIRVGRGPVAAFDVPVTDRRVFFWEFYPTEYADVAEAYRGDFAGMVRHWVEQGVPAGRVGAPGFSSRFYLNSHPDLKDAFGGDYRRAIGHFLESGLYEGRIASPVFDPVYYLRRHPDLIRAFGNTGFGEAMTHWVESGLNAGRKASPAFDHDYYFAVHEDMRVAFGSDHIAAQNHFVMKGLDEGRTGSPVFDPKYYLGRYDDLARAFGPQGYERALIHWLHRGIDECRQSSPAFDPRFYLDTYAELKTILHDDCRAARDHFLATLETEGRRGSRVFDPRYYLGRYPDLRAAFGDDAGRALSHWMGAGIAEGRQGSAEFDPVYYLRSNADVAETFGASHYAAILHWNTVGIAQGRRGVPDPAPVSESLTRPDERSAQ